MSKNSILPHEGYLSVIVGPMFSNKTTSLLMNLTILADTGYKTLFINHTDDTRSTDVISTHNSSYTKGSSVIDKIKCKQLSLLDVSKYDAIAIDECQNFDETFVEPDIFNEVNKYLDKDLSITVGQYAGVNNGDDRDLIETVNRWVNQKHIVVECGGLDGDSDMKPFGHILHLIPMANKVQKLSARCYQCLIELKNIGFKGDRTGIMAPFTACLINKTSQKLVGGADLYKPVCRYHHNNNR